MFRTLNGFFLAAYLLSAAVQYNDPDALPWVVVYLAAAGMCVAWYAGHLPKWYAAALLAVSVGWSVLLTPAIIGNVTPAEIVESVSMQTRAVEEAREIGGLLLVAIWALALLLGKEPNQ